VCLLLNVFDSKIVQGMNKIKFAKAPQANASITKTTKRNSPSIPKQIFGLTKCVKLVFCGAFAKLRKATMVARPPVPRYGAHFPLDGFSWDFIFEYFWKLKFHSNLTRITGNLHEHLRTFMIISRRILSRMRNVLDKLFTEIITHISCSITSLPHRAYLR